MLRKFVFLSALGLVLALLSPVQAQDGQVLWEFWFGGITDQVETLLADGRYPYGPDLTEYSTSFTADKPESDYYGGRGRAYLTPPETGDYTIWVWSDDDSLVYLSPDEDPANAELVASVSGWTGANEWTKYASQKSTPKAWKPASGIISRACMPTAPAAATSASAGPARASATTRSSLTASISAPLS